MPEAATYFVTFRNRFWLLTFLPCMFHLPTLHDFRPFSPASIRVRRHRVIPALHANATFLQQKTLNLKMFTLFCCQSSLLQFCFHFY
jgi:hypothetical protein